MNANKSRTEIVKYNRRIKYQPKSNWEILKNLNIINKGIEIISWKKKDKNKEYATKRENATYYIDVRE